MTDYVWDAGGDGTSWNDDDNWGGSGHPNSNADKATIGVGSASISMNLAGGTGTIGELVLGNGFSGTVTQAYGFTIDDAGAQNGYMTMRGGTWDMNNANLVVDGVLTVQPNSTAGSTNHSNFFARGGNLTVGSKIHCQGVWSSGDVDYARS